MSEASATITTSTSAVSSNPIGRWFGIAFGIGTQLLFLWTVVYLFLFLRYGGWFEYEGYLIVDTLLATCFAVPHSLLLAPATSKRLRQWFPSGLLGCLHCCVSCLTLLAMFHYWGTSSVELWRATGWMEVAILFCFYGSWGALLYSLYCTGMGYQTGLTQWWYWFRQTKPPVRPFVTTGAFQIGRAHV